MVIGIFGESCTGKSTLANGLRLAIGAQIFTGKDYLRLAKNEDGAKTQFRELLSAAVSGENVIYVITDPADLDFLPGGAVRVLATAELDLIKRRFAARMGGKLPPSVETMLERKHGVFGKVSYDLRVDSSSKPADDAVKEILDFLYNR